MLSESNLNPSTNMRGLSANPLNIEFVPEASLLNCLYSTEVVIGSNNATVNTPGANSTRFQDMQCRTLGEDVTKTLYNGLMYPNKNNIRKQRILAFEKSHPLIMPNTIICALDWKNNDGYEASGDKDISLATFAGACKYYFNNLKCCTYTYKDITEDKNCSHTVREGL